MKFERLNISNLCSLWLFALVFCMSGCPEEPPKPEDNPKDDSNDTPLFDAGAFDDNGEENGLDAGSNPVPDAGPLVDAGMPMTMDSGTSFDAGMSGDHDGGVSIDSGSDLDAGPQAVEESDAGLALDAGEREEDAGPSDALDAGAPPMTHPFLSEISNGDSANALDAFVEITGVAGLQLSNYSIAFFSDTGVFYGVNEFQDGVTIPDQSSGMGSVSMTREVPNGGDLVALPPYAFALIYDHEGSDETLVEFLSYGDSITPASGSVGSLDGISSESIAQIDEVADGHALQLVRIDSDPTRPSDEPHWVDRSVPSPGYLNPNLLSAWVDVKVYDAPTVVGETLYIRGNFDADGSHDPPSWEEASSHQLGWRDACSCWAGGFKWWLNQTLEYKMYIARPSSDDGWEGGLNRQLYLTSTDDFFLVINDWQN